MSRSNPERPAECNPAVDREPIRVILANLSGEICRPLETLQNQIVWLLDDSTEPALTEAERAQASTMLTLCDEIDRLTRECLGSPTPG